MGRLLVTTADERSWVPDRPTLFLGEWCCRYHRRSVWKKMDATVADPYGASPDERARDATYVFALVERIRAELVSAMNRFHDTRRSERYWNIVLGHWLERYVAVMFNRYRTIEQALRRYEIAGTIAFTPADYQLATADSGRFVRATDDDYWNHMLCVRLLSHRGDVPLEWMPAPGPQAAARDGGPPAASGTAKSALRSCLAWLGQRLAKDTDAFMVNTYLPRSTAAKLSLALGQIPQLWTSPVLSPIAVDPPRRKGLVLEFESYDGFERYVRWQLPDVIPTCYVEGYEQLVKLGEQVHWPGRPRFVFTANNFDRDEVFKVWIGAQVEQGTPYFVGQHGNNYGTHILANPDGPEHATADRFFTWGWTDGRTNRVPMFIVKTVGRRHRACDPSGGLLLIELALPHRIFPADTDHEHGLYQEEQFQFVDALSPEARDRLIIRLHVADASWAWSDRERWQDRLPDVKIDMGRTQIASLIASSRLVVHSYDSTGILETLSLNIPTMCFWRGGLDHLVPSAKPYYARLEDAGILHRTPAAAAAAVAARWASVGDWWHSREVQETRAAFCDRYARTVPHPIRTLRDSLTTAAREVRAGRPVRPLASSASGQ